MKKNNRNLKKAILVGSIGGMALAFLTGCNFGAGNSNTNTPSDAGNNKGNNEESFVPGDLDIDSNLSIENEVDAIYEANSEWYDDRGMDKDEIRDLIFVANDKYTDEDGKLIIDEDRAQEAYANIERIMGNAGSPILQKIDNINTKENDPEIGEQIDNSWNIIEYPTLTSYIDTDKAGGKATVEKLLEFEELRDYEVELMNKTGKYDRERINEFVIDMEINDYNTNSDNMDNIDKNGQKYIMAAYKDAALQFAAAANPQVIYLEGYKGINENIKINATNEERFLENDVIEMIQNGTLDSATVNDAIDEIISNSEKTENGMAYTGEEKVLLEKYSLTNDQLRLIMSYAHYLTTMADHKYKEVECDEEKETLDDIATKRLETASLGINKPKVLLLIPNKEGLLI